MRSPAHLSVVLFAAALAACGAATVQQPAGRPPPQLPALGEAEIGSLTELMLYEDTRTFDAAAFERLAGSPSDFIRGRTMLAAGRVGDSRAIPLLLRGLADASDSVAAYSAFALGELGDSSANVAHALGALASRTGASAVEAIAALGKIGGSHARPFVENVLAGRAASAETKEALLAIWRFARLPGTSALVRPFATAPDPEVRWRAVYALTRGGPDPANVRAFADWLRDSDPLVRALAVRGLRAATADSAGLRSAAAQALQQVLADPHPHVRINAATTLATYRDSTFADAVAQLLLDEDANVRTAAAQALGQVRGSRATAALQARVLAATERPPIRGSALGSLAQIDPAAAVARAREWTNAPDWLLRLYAARALAVARSADALQVLRTLAGDPDVRVQAQAVGSAASLAGDTLTSARAFFIERLAAADPFVRAAALAALQRLAVPGDEALIMEAFEFALRDPVAEAGTAALGVLARLAERNPAVRRAFVARFPLTRIPLLSVRQAAVRVLELEETCCALAARPDLYQRVVASLLVPALRGEALPRVRIQTAAGAFELELLAADAPLTVDNFMTLVRRDYYRGSRWHRVVPNFVLQDGDPSGTGSGGPGYAIRDEINRFRYARGSLGMALAGADTGGSQFFVTHSPQPHLDGGYTIFGRVISGMDVADRVVQDDPVLSIEVIE